MIIVLETSGKNDEVDYVKINLFEDKQEAEDYCRQNTDDPEDKKYWKYCEIINENHSYEIARYQNYP